MLFWCPIGVRNAHDAATATAIKNGSGLTLSFSAAVRPTGPITTAVAALLMILDSAMVTTIRNAENHERRQFGAEHQHGVRHQTRRATGFQGVADGDHGGQQHDDGPVHALVNVAGRDDVEQHQPDGDGAQGDGKGHQTERGKGDPPREQCEREDRAAWSRDLEIPARQGETAERGYDLGQAFRKTLQEQDVAGLKADGMKAAAQGMTLPGDGDEVDPVAPSKRHLPRRLAHEPGAREHHGLGQDRFPRTQSRDGATAGSRQLEPEFRDQRS